MYNKLLFNESELSNFLGSKKSSLISGIESYDAEYIFNTQEDELIAYLLDNYSLTTPDCLENKIHAEIDEANIEVRRNLRDSIYNDNRAVFAKGLKIEVTIPFTGNPDLFLYQPSSYLMGGNIPTASIKDDALIIQYETIENNPEKIKSLWGNDLSIIKQYLGFIDNDVRRYNTELKQIIITSIANRKKDLANHQNIIKNIGIPVKKRNDLPKTYAVPIKQKKVRIKQPIPNLANLQEPEPSLPEKEYENILEITQNMALTMERAPKSFLRLDEESTRDHFLMHLNGHYEGQATGETFNSEGKTDILIRNEGKNIFIAECKFWKGKKVFLGTIDQLLGYTSWRDTKTAILIFNKNKNLSEVLEVIQSSIKEHKQYIGLHEVGNNNLDKETLFSYRFKQLSDYQKELILTILVFDIPQ